MTDRLTPDDLARRTLARQFPEPTGTGVADLVRLYEALGPVQTQVPRAAFLFASSRLPGVTYATVAEAFESYALVKGTTLRGTVHSSTPRQHAWSAAVAGPRLGAYLPSRLALDRLTPDEVRAETAAYAAGVWRDRDDLVEHVTRWLARHESEGHGTVADSHARNLVWGAPQLIRRPPDERWHTRTDTLHRTGTTVYAVDEADHDVEHARAALVRVYLGAYGPARRRDVARWLGDTLGGVDRALARLGDEVVTLEGPDGTDYLDVADAPEAYDLASLGTRIVPEFDGLVIAYEGDARTRFIRPDHLQAMFAAKNGITYPAVLERGRMVAWCKLIPRGTAVDVQVEPFAGEPPPEPTALDGALADAAVALDVEIADVRVGAP